MRKKIWNIFSNISSSSRCYFLRSWRDNRLTVSLQKSHLDDEEIFNNNIQDFFLECIYLLLPFRAFCVEGPQNLMFVRPCVRPSVVCRLSVCHAQKRLSCTLGTLRDTILGLSAPHPRSKTQENLVYVTHSRSAVIQCRASTQKA